MSFYILENLFQFIDGGYRWKDVAWTGLELSAFRLLCKRSSTELPSRPVISRTSFQPKLTPVMQRSSCYEDSQMKGEEYSLKEYENYFFYKQIGFIK